MRESAFWNTVIDGIQGSIDNSSFYDGWRNNLFDIANAAYAIQGAINALDAYLDDYNNCEKFMDYSIYRGYQIGLTYHQQHKDTPRSSAQRIENVKNIGYGLHDLEDKFERSKNKKDYYKSLIKKTLNMMYAETEQLLLEEIERLDLVTYLKSIKPENRHSYLTKLMELDSKKWDLSTFVLNILKSEIL